MHMVLYCQVQRVLGPCLAPPPHRPVLKQLLATTTPARTPTNHHELLACAAGLSGIGRTLPTLLAPSSGLIVTWALDVVLPLGGLSDDVPEGPPRGRSWRAPSAGVQPKAAVLKMVTRALDTSAAPPAAYRDAAVALASGLAEILGWDGEEDAERYRALGCQTEIGMCVRKQGFLHEKTLARGCSASSHAHVTDLVGCNQ